MIAFQPEKQFGDALSDLEQLSYSTFSLAMDCEMR